MSFTAQNLHSGEDRDFAAKNSLSPRSRRLGGKSAFTFLEILFAVIILGTGFIMLAGLFPAAIQQTQANVSETAGSTVGRDALRDIQAAVGNYVAPPVAGAALLMLPPTNNPNPVAPFANLPVASYVVMPIPNETVEVPSPGQLFGYSTLFGTAPTILPTANPYNNLTNPAIVALNHLCTTDPRFGWVGFYRRDWTFPSINGAVMPTPSPYAQVWIITGQSTAEGQTTYSSAGPVISSSNIVAATVGTVKVSTGIYTGYIVLPTASAAAVNTFALIMSSGDSQVVGQVVRLGSAIGSNTGATPPTTIWSLVPGSDLNGNDTNLPLTLSGTSPSMTASSGENVTVFILGSPLVGSTYQGNSQDLTCTTGFIRVSN
jgi:type II secretory pathway pseudopilin PulG